MPRWFPGARLNYTENLLWRADDAIAITESNESGHTLSCSWRELREQVRKLAAALKAHGLKPGDRVAGSSRVWILHVLSVSLAQAILANRTMAVVIVLATASLGGIFTSTATDMGPKVYSFHVTSISAWLNCTIRVFWTAIGKFFPSSSSQKPRPYMLERSSTWCPKLQRSPRIFPPRVLNMSYCFPVLRRVQRPLGKP